MANWDDAQLAEVVERRHGEENRKKNATQIVSYEINIVKLIQFIAGVQILPRSCGEQYLRVVLELS